MHVIYVVDRRDRDRVSEGLAVGKEEARLCADWMSWFGSLPSADVAGVVLRRFDVEALHRLEVIRAQYPALPLVVIGPRDPEIVRWLFPIAPIEVLWLDELRCELGPALARRSASRALASLAVALQRAENLPARLRTALCTACRGEPPILRVSALAAASGSPESTLRSQWRRLRGKGSARRLEDVLHWVLLIRAIPLRRSGCSWMEVSERLGVHEHTLQRAAETLTAQQLGALVRDGQPALAGRFRAWLSPLVVAQAGSVGGSMQAPRNPPSDSGPN